MVLAYILNIETSTKNCSVSIAKNGKTIAFTELATQGYSHAEKLHPFIEEVVKKANIFITDVDAVAVSKGPGSYTGLRIGVSAAKGICFALAIPLISVNTLHSLALMNKNSDGYTIALIDARRMEVYSSVFNNKKEEVVTTKAEIITENSFKDFWKNSKVYLVGDGVEKCKDVIKSSNVVFTSIQYPSAISMGELSFQKYSEKQFEDVAYFEPFYLKDFIVTTSKK